MLPSTTSALPGVFFSSSPAPAATPLPPLDMAAFVGFAERGPLHYPFPVTDIVTYREVFGGNLALARDPLGNSEPAYLPGTVAAYFANGGRRCRIVRVAGPGARPARLELPGVVAVGPRRASPPETRQMTVAASSPGRWGNHLRLTTRLRVTPLPHDAFCFPAIPPISEAATLLWRASGDPEAVLAGDLLEIRLDNGRCGWFPVRRVDMPREPSGRFSLVADGLWPLRLVPPASPPREIGRLGPEGVSPLPVSAAWNRNSPGLSLILSGSDDPATLNGLRPGDVLQLGLLDGSRHLFGVEQVGPAETPNSPPFPAVALRSSRLLELSPTGLDGLAVASPPPRVIRVERLRFDLLIRLGETARPTLEDLGLNVGHPRFFGNALVPDDGVGAPRDEVEQHRRVDLWRKLALPLPRRSDPHAAPEYARIDPARDGRPDSALLSGLLAPLDVTSGQTTYLPLAMRPLAGTRGRLVDAGDDDLGRFDAAAAGLFLDPELVPFPNEPAAFTSPQAMPAAAFDRYYRRNLRLQGLHALLFEEPVALIGLPDATHRNWAESPAPRPEAEAEATADAAAEPPPAGFGDCPAAPSVAGVKPAQGPIEGGIQIRLRGSGFIVGATRVRFDAAPALAVQVRGEHELTCWLPPGRGLGPVAVDVATEFGSGRLEAGFRYVRGADRPLLPLLAEGDRYDLETGPLLALHQAVIGLCQARADLVALLSLPAAFDRRHCIAWWKGLRGRLGLGDRNEDADSGFNPGADLSFAAVFHPWPLLRQTDGVLARLPPDGLVAAAIADGEQRKGVWIAPANQPLRGVLGLSVRLSEADRTELFRYGFNLLAEEPRGFKVASAHTLSDQRRFLQLSVRRLLILLRKAALEQGLEHVFDNDSETTRGAVRLSLETLLRGLYERGAFAGATQGAAFRIDLEALPRPEAREGQLLARLRVAPSQPLEFITLVLTRNGAGLLQAAEV